MTTDERTRTDAVALVTGGSGGIGTAIAVALSESGHTVLVGYRSDEAAAQATVDACTGKAEAVRLDVTDAESVAAAIERAGDLGTLRVVVNNAGIAEDDLLMRLSPERWERQLDVNLTGAYRVSQAALRPMLRARGGRIINIGSIVGLRGNAGQTAYAAAKAGLIGFSKSLAREIARKGITVNVVAPGYVETAMTEALPDEARASLRDLAPIGRAVLPTEVGAAVSFLASDGAAAITGAVIPVDGGAAI